MIIYDLQCEIGHKFEAWFVSPQSFEDQHKNGLIACSHCGLSRVSRLPAGGHVQSHAVVAIKKPASPSAPFLSQSPSSHKMRSDQMINMDPVTLIKAVTKYVKENCTDVGDKFATKAISMHKGEEANAPIYGTATASEHEILTEEGIDYTLIPKLPEEFDN